jgi:hypothetical protein
MDWFTILTGVLLFGSIPMMFALGRLIFGPDPPSRGDGRHDPSRASNVTSAMQNDMGGR